MALEITDGNFETHVLNTPKLIVLDFWAQWCGPCKIVSEAIEDLAKDYKEKAIIGKVDVDINPNLCSKYGVRNMPTVLYIQNGEVVDKHIGTTTMAVLEEKLKSFL
ncbi:MAG: thioredoxin 1 [Saprospiraceae bacterium]|jgi:thioredoxin 1